MAFAPRRRRRRRGRWLLVGVVLSIVALSVNASVSSRSREPGRRLARLAYVDQVRPHVERSAAHGADVAQVRDDAGTLGRDGIRRRMDRVRRDAAAELRAVRAVDPPDGLATGHSLLLSTMILRARATTELTRGLDGALGEGPVEPSVGAIAAAGQNLVAADQTYATFVELVREALPGEREELLPESRWVLEPAVWTRTEVSAFVSALRSSAISAPVHDLGLLTLATDPAPVASEAGTAVLPMVRTLRVELVVANIGNKSESNVLVLVTLTGPAGEVDTAREFVDLAPGQRRAIALGGLRPVPGGPSTLSAVVGPVDGEAGVADNQRSFPLVLRG